MSTLQSFNARTGQAYGAALPATTTAELNTAIDKAGEAFDGWQASDGASRANLLNALAAALEQDREKLVELADAETGLGLPRLNGELDRTAFQLRRFATIAQSGGAFAFTDDPAVAGAPPAGHPAMMRVRVPLGPVAMFSASNFPFAFSVLGGDTASALAAGCSVVVKAHSGHLHTSARVYQLARQTLAALGLHEGLIQMVQGAGSQVGVALVQHPTIAAGAFTGSTRGGAALRDAARARPRPIPFYGELGSINPVIATAEALQKGGDALVQTLAGSITLGCGQFCTNPGLLVLQRSPESQAFVAALTEALKAIQPHAMLTQGMRQALDAGTAKQLAAGAKALLNNPVPDICPKPFLAEVDAATFIDNHQLQEEVFGPLALIIAADSDDEMLTIASAFEGQLTCTLHLDDADTDMGRRLMPILQRKAGRVLANGFPTGVEVVDAMVHGGPYPASTNFGATSVGTMAIRRWLRPVSYQNLPQALWPEDLRG